MKDCWIEEKESRPAFMALKEEFDAIISHEERYNYLPLDLETAEEGVGPAEEDLGPAEEGVGPAEEGVGPAEEGLGPAEEGLGPAEEGVGSLEFAINETAV